MYEQNGTALKIFTHLLNSNTNVRLHDIKNEVVKLQRAELGGRSLIVALMDHLNNYANEDEGGENVRYFVRADYDSDNRVRNLFLAHPDSLKIIKENPDVIQIDATDKAN